MSDDDSKLKKYSLLVYALFAILAVFLCDRMMNRVQDMAPDNVIYVTQETDLYPDPSEQSISITKVRKGQKLILKEKGEKFHQVTDGSISGYIKTEYLSETPPQN